MIVDGKYVYQEGLPFWANYSIAAVECLELDPVYCAVRASIPEIGLDRTHRFLMAMSLFYNMGTACYIADNTTQETFWDFCIDNYKTLKRGTERRYFHGEQGMRCLNYVKQHYKGPTDFIESNHAPTYKGILANFAKIPAYGNYHTWKFWDFYDRILGMRVEADESCWKAIPSEPLDGLEKVALEMGMPTDNLIEVGKYCVKFLQDLKLMSPPDNDRLVHIAEVETDMCMISHHLRGSDWVGLDLISNHTELTAIDSPTAKVMAKNFPELVGRDFFVPPPDVVAKVLTLFPKYKPYKAEPENTTTNLLAFA
jgi:hypothetical protein